MNEAKKERIKDFEIRGVKSVLISRAIQFLDMIQQGYAEFGKIEDTQAPEEFSDSGTIAFGSAMIVLGKFDPDIKKSFSQGFREKLAPEISARTAWFLRITIFGPFLGIAILFLLIIMRGFDFLSSQIFIALVITGFAVVIVLVCMITIYAFKNQGKDPPQGVIDAIAEPQIRFEAERAFEKIINIFQEESNQPIRVIVVGNYDAFDYTGSTYITSKDIELKLAILNPKDQILRDFKRNF